MYPSDKSLKNMAINSLDRTMGLLSGDDYEYLITSISDIIDADLVEGKFLETLFQFLEQRMGELNNLNELIFICLFWIFLKDPIEEKIKV